MTIFKYQARDKQGKFITGSREAGSRELIVSYLRGNGLSPISIEEVKLQAKSQTRSQTKRFEIVSYRLKDKEIIFFTRQLSNLLDSGISIPRSLSILANQAKNPRIKEIIAKINDEVAGGGYFWEALSRYPVVFSPLYVSTVKAGETGGGLEEVVRSLADFSEQRREIKDTLTSMLIYPAILLMVGIGTIIFLMAFVVPKMLFIFEDLGQSLPLITKILIAASIFLSKYWLLLGLLCIAGFFILKRLYSRKQVRLRVDRFLHKLPLIGETRQKIILSRFCHILGLVLSNGVSMLGSLDIAREVVQNELIAESMGDVRLGVSQGSTISDGLARAGIFPSVMVDMISVGEETGRLEDALSKIAQIYDKESREEIKRLISLLEPALIFLLALGVGLLVVAMLLPIFQMNLQAM